MNTQKRSLSDYTDLLGIREMKAIMAGDDLPEVIVHSSYSKVHGMNYSMWLYQQYGMNPWGYGAPGAPAQGLEPVGDGGGGGGGTGSGPVSDPTILDRFLQGLGIGLGVNGITQESLALLLAEGSMLSRIAQITGVAGLITSTIQILLKINSGQELNAGDWITIGLVLVGAVLVSTGGGALIGVFLGLIGIGNDLWAIYQGQQGG